MKTRAVIVLTFILLISSIGPGIASSGHPELETPLAPPAPVSGVVIIDYEWSVINIQRFLNATIYLTGNLTVTSTGNLEFVNTTLAMNISRNGQYKIKVDGKFTMADLDMDPSTQADASVIKSNNTAFKYFFQAIAGSRVYLNNSVVTNCGYDGQNQGMTLSGTATLDGMLFQNNYYGLIVKSSSVKVVNSTVSGGIYGIYSYFCNPILRNLTIIGSTVRGMYLYYSKPVLEDCVFLNNRVGIYFQNSEPRVLRCNITGSTTAGITAWYSSPLLEDSWLSNSLDMEVRMGSFPRLLNTHLNESRVSIDLGYYASVGQHLKAYVVNSTGAPQSDITVAVLDEEGNPASSGMTNESGIANDLAFREKLLTRNGPIVMASHRIMAFSLAGDNMTFGVNSTMLTPDSTCAVLLESNPSETEIWPSGMVINETMYYNNTNIIVLGNLIISGGSLELENSHLMVFSSSIRTVSVSAGEMIFIDSSLSSIGTTRLLEPSRALVTTEADSPVYMVNSSLRWTTEFIVKSSLSEFHNLSVTHASLSGIKITACSPRLSVIYLNWTPIGLYLNGDSSKISDVHVTNARDYAVYAAQSSSTIDNLKVDNSSSGLYSYNGMMAITNAEMRDCSIAIFPYYSIMELGSMNITGSNMGIYAVDSDIRFIGGTISDSGTAVHVQTSGFWGEDLFLANNGIGIQSSVCSPVILNSTLNNTIDVKVDRGSSASLVNCTLSQSRTEVQASGFIDIGNWTHISVVDESLQPVPGCNVSIMDQVGRVSGSGVTGSDGILRNIAFREARLLWNRSEVQTAHRILAFRDFNGSLQGSVSSSIFPGQLIVIPVSQAGIGWMEWTQYRNIFSNESYSNMTIVTHAGAQVDFGAMLELDNVELLVFGASQWSTSLEIKIGGLDMHNVRIAPLSAFAPLQPSVVWVTYQAGSSGRIENSSFTGITQVTTYTSELSVMNTTFREFPGAGLSIQSCSPVISDSRFYMCGDGIWSTSGSPIVTDSEFLECTMSGFYADGGNSQISGIQSSGNVNGIMLENMAGGNITGCAVSRNNYGIYLFQSSTSIRDSGAFNNTESGIHLYESHPDIANTQSMGNYYGLNAYKSWPVIFNTSFSMNNNGIYSYQSAPYLQDCQIDKNDVGIQTLMDATGIPLNAFSSGKATESAIFVGSEIRDHISVTLPSRALVRSANMSIRGSEIGPDAVIEDAYTQFYPVMYENWIVWQDLRNEDWDIYAYNLSMDSDDNGVPNYLETPPLMNDPALLRITNNPYMQGEPDIYGDTIVWTDYRNGNPDIYAYTFSNSTEWIVCDDYSAQLKPSIHGDRIVWQDLRNGNYDIFALNISTGEISQLSDSNNHDMSPSVFGDFVVWYSYYGSPPSSDYSDIVLFDMKSWTLMNINDDVPIQYNPEIYGNTVVWHDDRNVDWEIYSYDIPSSTITRITNTVDGHQNFMPSVYTDTVVYYTHNRINGAWGVRMSNLTTGVQTILQKDVDGDSHPVIYGSRIAWVNRTGNLNDIYVLDMGLTGNPEDVTIDINMDGTSELNHPGTLDGQTYLNGTWLAEVFNTNLDRIDSGTAKIPMSVAANGTGRVTLGPIKLVYDIPTYLVNCSISNSTTSGARSSGSTPTFVNSTFMTNALDFSMNSEARPRTLNSSFSDAKLHFQDNLSNLTVQNYLHVGVRNLTGDPLDARIVVEDNDIQAHDAFTGADGNLMWMPVTDRTYNLTGMHDNITIVTAIMDSNIFANNPRSVNMSSPHWEYFQTDSVGPEASNPFPPPGWTTPQTRPEISVIITDNLAIDLSSVRLHIQGFSVFYSYTAVPGGYNISYVHPMNYPNGTVVVCRIIARDFDGNMLDYSWEFKIDIRAEAFTIELEPGWNLISLPFDTYNASIDSVLWPISGKYDIVRAYSPGGVWLRYRPASSPEFNDISTMSRGVGYWIHATEPCLLEISGVPVQSTSITLYAGWNLVGYSSMTETTVANALWGTTADRVEVHDAGSPYLISAVDSTYPMKPGQGFWVRVPADTVWVIDW